MKSLTLLLVAFLSFSGFSQVKSEEILLKNKKIELLGTLTFTAQKSPLIIWVHGSGNVDRNGNQMPIVKANYIKQFRDSINKRGIAFYSYDKRTAVANNKENLKGVTFEDFTEDLKIAINHFKKDKRFSSITLLGHSQGSLTAMLASKNVDNYISLAGASRTIDEVITEQVKKNSPMALDTVKSYLKELKETGNIKYVNPLLKSLFSEQNQPFLKSWINYNPVKEIKRLKIPILIVNGTKDLQIPVKDAESLHKANPKSKLLIIENMNHVIKDIQQPQDNMKSYYSADYPLSVAFITAVYNFVK